MTNEVDPTVHVVSTNTTIVSGAAGPSRVAAAMVMPPAEKPGKFSGVDFKRWQQKMFFNLTTLSLQRFIKEDAPVLTDETPENERFLVIEAWKHSDFLCKNYILSGLEDDLYNVYSNVETSKKLWDILEKKYKTEDAGLKKFVAAKFLDYKMVDNKSVVSQVQELQVLIHDLLTEGLKINEAFQVAAMIEKLPPSWNDFKNYLKHKRKEMTLEDLVVRLRIEEDNKSAAKKARGSAAIAGANIVEHTPNQNKRKKPSGGKTNPSKKKFKGNCYNCGKSGHKSADCRAAKKDRKKEKGQANMVKETKLAQGVQDIDLCAMISECNLVGNPKEWWIDSGATRHVCAVKEAFASYAPAGPDEALSMGNSATAKIEGYGKIFLKMRLARL